MMAVLTRDRRTRRARLGGDRMIAVVRVIAADVAGVIAVLMAEVAA